MTEEPSLTPDFSEIVDAADAVEGVQSTLEAFIETADVSRVYAEPVQNGEITLIPAAEVLVGLGFGMGYGFGQGADEEDSGSGGGGGGGGGGRTLSRPVAVVVASPEGVRVEPIIDVTKVALAALTAGGFMLATMLRMAGPKKALKT
jgi:uncharacterized spore protein YtfJ